MNLTSLKIHHACRGFQLTSADTEFIASFSSDEWGWWLWVNTTWFNEKTGENYRFLRLPRGWKNWTQLKINSPLRQSEAARFSSLMVDPIHARKLWGWFPEISPAFYSDSKLTVFTSARAIDHTSLLWNSWNSSTKLA